MLVVSDLFFEQLSNQHGNNEKMKFFAGLTPFGFGIYFMKMLIPAAILVLAMNYVSAASTERGDTNLVDAFLLMMCFIGSIVCFQDSVRKLWHEKNWRNALYLGFSTFSLYYFFKIYICCVSIPGAMV
jgi:hypothetical protein